MMRKYLEDVVNDKNLVWDKSLETQVERFLVKLNDGVIGELKRNISNSNVNESDFPLLEKEIRYLKEEFLINGVGFFIIDGTTLSSFSKEDTKKIYDIISKQLGKLYIQNIQNEYFVEIKDIGKLMKSGGRYHHTKEGGSYHSDSPQWQIVPDYIGMYCVNPAKKGGVSKFVSAYSIHNHILKNEEKYLKTLYEKFYFDKRGEFEEGESPTVYEPIFQLIDDKLNCRYLRDYIDAGHKISNKPLTEDQIMALDYFDEISMKQDIVIDYNLKSRDMAFFNNHRILHGRTNFEDFDDERLKRLMIRTWIKDIKS